MQVTLEEYCAGFGTGLAELGRLLGAGGLQALVRGDRTLVVRATPAASEVAYAVRADGRLVGATGAPVTPGTCPAGVWVALEDVIPGSADVSAYGSVSPFYVERSVFNAQTGRLRLYPRGSEGGGEDDTSDTKGEV